MSKPKSCEIVIAVDKPRNGNVYFYPTNCAIEGTFKPWRTPGAKFKPPILALGEIPGERVHLDVKGKTGRISHALRDPDNAKTLEKVRRAARTCQPPVICGEAPKEDRWFRNLTEEQVNTWLYWMRRLVDEGKATILQGQLPGLDELKTRKDILRPSYDSRARGGRYYEFDTETAGV